MNWLLVDGSWLARRAWYTTGHLSHGGQGTGVAFGFLRDLDEQRALHAAEACLLAFDAGGPGRRAEIFPGYKAGRRRGADDPVEREQEADYRRQVRRLRRDLLPALGYANVLAARGYEADDILALAAAGLPAGDRAVILTSDNDLWQCLRENVSWYTPAGGGRAVTAASFRREWEGLDPAMWASVKALAGCPTDDVPGVAGVGPRRAARWFAGRLKPESKAFQAINANLEVHNRNIALTRLPFPGLTLPPLRPDRLTQARRAAVFRELGFRRGRRREDRKKEHAAGFGLESR